MFKALITLGGVLLLAGHASAAPEVAATTTQKLPSKKKLIHLGWDQPTTEYARDHWKELDETAPFDGVTFEVRFSDEGQNYTEYHTMTPKKWRREALQVPLKNLQSTRFKKLTNNFIRVNSPLGYMDWYDDAAWNAAIGNVADLAWLAKQATNAHIKGISFDTETYNAKQYQWRADSGHSFAEASAQVRKRGAQMMKAVTAEYPDITIWALWLFSKTQMSGNVSAQLPSEDYGLWPAFVNGWLDALPPQARLVDGMEEAYYFTRLEDFAEVYATLRSVNSPLISSLLAPENKTKYQTQVSIAFGIYLDTALDAPSSGYYRGPLNEGETRIDRMRQTIATALNVSDEYVWLYNEQVKWWPIGADVLPDWGPNGKFTRSASKRPGQGRVAEEAFPGITQAVNLARDPRGTAQRMLSDQKDTVVPNAVVNGSFAQGEAGKLPTGWWDWQKSDSHGTIGRDDAVSQDEQAGSLLLSGVNGGALVQTIAVEPGHLYAISGWVKRQGAGEYTIRTRWATAKGVWNNIDKDVITIADGSPAQEGWERFFEVVQVPQGSPSMRILLGVSNQLGGEAKIWYDAITVNEIS